MEIKNIVTLEIEKEKRIYRLELPIGAPLGEAYDATATFLEKLVLLINENAEKTKTNCCGEKCDGQEKVEG